MTAKRLESLSKINSFSQVTKKNANPKINRACPNWGAAVLFGR
jgi:hypothetical protein